MVDKRLFQCSVSELLQILATLNVLLFRSSLVQLIYLPLVQMELQKLRKRWNCHRIRRQKRGDIISGIPHMLYFHPEQGQYNDHDKQLPFI